MRVRAPGDDNATLIVEAEGRGWWSRERARGPGAVELRGSSGRDVPFWVSSHKG